MNASPDIVAEAPVADAPVADAPHHLTDGQINTIYTAAYRLSERGRYDQACALFALLRMVRPDEPKYSHAAGICFRKMGNYEQAISFFARAMELKPHDFGPAFQLVECLMLLGRREEARQVLQTIVGSSRNFGEELASVRASALMSLIEEHS